MHFSVDRRLRLVYLHSIIHCKHKKGTSECQKKKKGELFVDPNGTAYLYVDKKWFRMEEGKGVGKIVPDPEMPLQLEKYATVVLSEVPKQKGIDA